MSVYKTLGLDFDYQDKPKNYYEASTDKPCLDKLENFIKHDLVHPLKQTAQNTVFSNRSHNAEIMIIGEGPGAEEDAQGLPFVGKSGQLLTLMLKAIKLSRDEVYITNLVPWRPPGNRNPTREEMDFFLPHLKQHIYIKKPKFIILLGGIVTKALFGEHIQISKVRGKWLELKIKDFTFKFLPTFHPSYLLRSPKQKKLAWYDLLIIQKNLNTK